MWNTEAPSSAMCVPIEKRNRLGFATIGLRVRGDTRPEIRANLRRAGLTALSGDPGGASGSVDLLQLPPASFQQNAQSAADRPPLCFPVSGPLLHTRHIKLITVAVFDSYRIRSLFFSRAVALGLCPSSR